jgi:energy-converting hydrogenase Eha subunit A
VVWATVRLALASGVTTREELSPDAPQVDVIVYGIVGTLVVTGVVAWGLMAPIRSSFRRFGLTMVAVLGGFVVAAGATALVRETLGIAALPGLAGLGALLTVAAARRARRLARGPAG